MFLPDLILPTLACLTASLVLSLPGPFHEHVFGKHVWRFFFPGLYHLEGNKQNGESWIRQGRAAQSRSEGELNPAGAGPGGSEQETGRAGSSRAGRLKTGARESCSLTSVPSPTPHPSRLGDANTELLQGESRSPVAVRAARGDESLLKLSPLMTHMCQVSSKGQGTSFLRGWAFLVLCFPDFRERKGDAGGTRCRDGLR